jgi:hypothetical protein
MIVCRAGRTAGDEHDVPSGFNWSNLQAFLKSSLYSVSHYCFAYSLANYKAITRRIQPIGKSLHHQKPICLGITLVVDCRELLCLGQALLSHDLVVQTKELGKRECYVYGIEYAASRTDSNCKLMTTFEAPCFQYASSAASGHTGTEAVHAFTTTFLWLIGSLGQTPPPSPTSFEMRQDQPMIPLATQQVKVL